IGHVLTLIFGLLYLVTFWRGSKAVGFFYNVAFVGASFSFGIVFVNDVVKAKRFRVPRALLSDDNVHYFVLASFWLLLAPVTTLALPPFVLFSFFHVLTYTRSTLLPLFLTSTSLSDRIYRFVREYNDKSLEAAAFLELVLLMWLIARCVAFRHKSLATLLVFSFFAKLRYENSIFTRQVIKSWEFQVDTMVAKHELPPAVKSTWISVKQIIRNYVGHPLAAKVEEKTK
ncbi:hypothetical protein BABINDRAFT_36303, partial [Babjeviella inositovora NRRL Y-12698]